MIALLLLACGGGPFENDAPRLVSVNGVDNHRLFGLPGGQPNLHFVAGTDFEIRLELDDPEGHDIRVWWPWSPPGWDFDPDASTGVWHVPAVDSGAPPLNGSPFVLILEDDHPRDPQASETYVPLWTTSGWDTGFDTGSP